MSKVRLATFGALVGGALGMVAAPAQAKGKGGYSFSVVAKLGDAVPGGSGHHVGDFEAGDINARGEVLFVSDTDQGSEGLFTGRNGQNTTILMPGQPAPGTDYNFNWFGALSPVANNDAGDAVFGWSIDDPTFSFFQGMFGIWRYDASKGAISPVIVPGQAAPGGTTFRGAEFHSDINNSGDVAASAVIDTAFGNCTNPEADCYGYGRGVYKVNKHGNAVKIAAPGDPAPGSSGTLNDAWDPNMNDRGDIVFGGHVTGEPCGNGDSSTIGCYESLYLYRASTGQLSSLVHQGDPKPGGGTFDLAFNGRLNKQGDISFVGAENWLTGYWLLQRDGALVTVAAPGDALPGGTMATGNFSQGCHGINGAAQVSFCAQLDADVDGDGVQDTGVYLYDGGSITTVVRTGQVIPGLGTVAHVNSPYFVGAPYPWPLASLNDRGQIFTQVIMTDGNTYAVIATPN